MSADAGGELVDVVDAEGRTVGTVTRREMRARRLPHRCVYVLVFHTDGRLFIHLRTPTKDVYPAHWDVAVGGVLSAGESFAAGARREAAEEMGVEVEPEPLFPFRYEDAATVVQAEVFGVTHSGPFRLQPEEVVCGEFVAVAEALARAARDSFCPDGLAVLDEYLRRGGERGA
jgi:isopentenyldiphosphate isomerase